MQSGWDSLLSLEDQFHQEGHALGLRDGQQAGRAEGREFGMTKAFEKFSQLGKLHGRMEILRAELLRSAESGATGQDEGSRAGSNSRLLRHIEKLLDLSDVQNVQPENNEDAVADLDERLREANSKAVMIARITGENFNSIESLDAPAKNSPNELEDFRAKTRFDKDAT